MISDSTSARCLPLAQILHRPFAWQEVPRKPSSKPGPKGGWIKLRIQLKGGIEGARLTGAQGTPGLVRALKGKCPLALKWLIQGRDSIASDGPGRRTVHRMDRSLSESGHEARS